MRVAGPCKCYIQIRMAYFTSSTFHVFTRAFSLGIGHNLGVGVASIRGGQRFWCTEMGGGNILMHRFRGGRQNFGARKLALPIIFTDEN